MTKTVQTIFIHGSGCKAAGTGRREDCTCNLRGDDYDKAWVDRRVFEDFTKDLNKALTKAMTSITVESS